MESRQTPRPIVITPYYREDPGLLKRCIASVRNQKLATEHMLVADGHPQDWIDHEAVRHLRLDRSHADFGNAARGIAATLAAAEGYWPISMLDADNWLEPEHVEVCLSAAASSPASDFVIARRNFCRVDGTIMPIEDQSPAHVDTNCFVFFPGSYHMLPVWALLPPQMAAVGDQVFWNALRARGLAGVVADRVTVNYHCTFESLYRALGELPPPGAKPNVDWAPVFDWWSTLSAREKELFTRITGLRPGPVPPG